jgi:hypothetical protein
LCRSLRVKWRERPIKALLDPYNPIGSTSTIRFNTSRADRWGTNGPPPKNHVNWVILDSEWEECTRVGGLLRHHAVNAKAGKTSA